MAKKIIIDTDPGIDDAMAILFAFASAELDVIALTTIFGNVATPLATANALRLVETAGAEERTAVAGGAAVPLVVPFLGAADFVHGADGFGNVSLPPPQSTAVRETAAEFIVQAAHAHPREITLLTLGPLTNIALALALEPRLPELISEVVVMGGAVATSGNVSPVAEANIIHDPHAADIVFGAEWPLSLVGLDVTMQVWMDQAYIEALRREGGKTARFIAEIWPFYAHFHSERHGQIGSHTHDPAAVAYLIDPTLFETISAPARVVCDGIAIGQTILDRVGGWRRPNGWSGRPPIRACLGVDAARLLALYRERITAAP